MSYPPEMWRRECNQSIERSRERRGYVRPHPWPTATQWAGALLAVLLVLAALRLLLVIQLVP